MIKAKYFYKNYCQNNTKTYIIFYEFTKERGEKMEELDLKELFLIFWNRKIEILLITLIFVVIGILYSYFYLVPVYKSSTTLILAQSSSTAEQKGESSITQTDLTLNSKLVSTYSEIMKRKSVLSKVVSNLGMSEKDIDEIKKNVSVKAVSDTELIEITVKNKEPEKAAVIANEIAKVFSEKVVEIYNISNIYILDRAEANPVPCNINHVKDIVIFAFIGIVISIIICLIANMLDTTIKTEEDVEKTTGLLVLTSIPDYNIEVSRKGGRNK